MKNIAGLHNLPDVFYIDEEQRGCIHIMSQKEGFFLPPHNHCFFHLNYMLWGSLEITVGDKVITAHAGSVFVLPPNMPHSLYSPTGYSQIGLDVLKKDRGIYKMVYDTFSDKPAVFSLEYLINDFKNLNINFAEATPIEQQLLFNFIEKVTIKTVKKQQDPNKNDFSTSLQNILKKEDIYSLTVEDICRHLYISKTHLERLMKKTYGCGVKQYINSRKLADIHYYLIETDLSVGEIAKKLKFYDSAHLITFFKRHTGGTPAAFRKNAK